MSSAIYIKQLIQRLVEDGGARPDDPGKAMLKTAGAPSRIVVVACSDCPPAVDAALQAVPGDLLLLKNPGNIVPPYGSGSGGEVAALEHAIDVEGVRDVVVLGHSHCAAVTRLVDPERQRSPSAMDAFLRHSEGVCRALSERRRHLQPGMLVDIAAQENVLLQLEHLRGHPSVVLHRFSDPVRLYAWFFHVNSGRVLAYNELQRRFQPLDQNYEREIARSISSK